MYHYYFLRVGDLKLWRDRFLDLNRKRWCLAWRKNLHVHWWDDEQIRKQLFSTRCSESSLINHYISHELTNFYNMLILICLYRQEPHKNIFLGPDLRVATAWPMVSWILEILEYEKNLHLKIQEMQQFSGLEKTDNSFFFTWGTHSRLAGGSAPPRSFRDPDSSAFSSAIP